jgi:polar amino acid transport system substrate-binding protein
MCDTIAQHSQRSILGKVALVIATLVLALCMGLLSGCTGGDYTPEPSEQKVDDSLLHTPGTLRVGVDASNAPYAAESQGAIVGIDVDVAAALADELGLKLELVDVGTNAEQAFTSDDVDIVMGVGSDAQNCWVSEPYLSSTIVLFATEENASVPSTTDVFTVAAQASSMSAVEVTNRLGQDHLEATADIQAAFDQLKDGSANYVATDSTIGSYVAHTAGMTIYPVALLAEATNYCIGAPTTAAGLQDAVSNALKTLSDGGILKLIDQKWLGTQLDFTSLTLIEPIPEPEPEEGEGDEANTSDTESGSDSESASSNE